MKKTVADLNVRAMNVLFLLLGDRPGSSTDYFNGIHISQEEQARIWALGPRALKCELRALAKTKAHSVSWLLRSVRGSGNVTTHMILQWISESSPDDEHTCVCRKCGKKMGKK